MDPINHEQREQIRMAWTAALRSGKYQQGKGFLNSSGKYCCLGVLCEVALRAVPGLVEVRTTDEEVTSYGDRSDILPFPVRDLVGLNTGNGDFDCFRSLTAMNDAGRTFAEIADLIEGRPKGLFVD